MQAKCERIRIVREYLGKIEDPKVRCVCFLLSKGRDDHAICRQMKIRKTKLAAIKKRISEELLEAGIVLRGNNNEQKEQK